MLRCTHNASLLAQGGERKRAGDCRKRERGGKRGEDAARKKPLRKSKRGLAAGARAALIKEEERSARARARVHPQNARLANGRVL